MSQLQVLERVEKGEFREQARKRHQVQQELSEGLELRLSESAAVLELGGRSESGLGAGEGLKNLRKVRKQENYLLTRKPEGDSGLNEGAVGN